MTLIISMALLVALPQNCMQGQMSLHCSCTDSSC